MTNVVAICCDCSSNPEFDTTFYACDVKDECNCLGIPENDWIKYALNDLFIDCPEWTDAVKSVIIDLNVRSITLTLGGDVVRITKYYSIS
jgi:hypothetical protein